MAKKILIPEVLGAQDESSGTRQKAPDTAGYEKSYSEGGFWGKAQKYASKVGMEGTRQALRLYYALRNPEMPARTKTMIYGALGYFISPLDLIPDFIPAVGFTDDIWALAAAIAVAATYITDDVKKQADAKLTEWFGEQRPRS